MSEVTVLAYAKINISLDVLNRREDGYHNLKSVMQSITLADEITIKTGEEGIRVYADLPYVPSDCRNIGYKAAELFYRDAGISPEVLIKIKKNIPVGAGLGGGSADAAAILKALNKLYKNPLSKARLLELGLKCGADVPFCLEGGTCLAEGLGEVLTPLPPLPSCAFILVKPPFSINTKQIFSSLDVSKITCRPDTNGILEAIKKNNLSEISVRMFNVLEDFTGCHRKDLSALKGRILESGAKGAVMSGSGSCVFGIFKSMNHAKEAAAYFGSGEESVFSVKPHIAKNKAE